MKVMRFIMRYSELYEATRPYVKKAVDPALMTFNEYLKVADPESKSHPSTAYDFDLADINRIYKVTEFPKILNTITVNGIQFEVREQKSDRWDGKYVKTDRDGEIVRDENGMAMHLSRDEISKIIPAANRYVFEFAVVRKDTSEIVGVTTDEWGALLVVVAQEYRNFGFGTLLVKLKRSREPLKGSGGFTTAGFNNFRRVHAEMVRDYMASGMYSHLVNTGVISSERAKEIISSIGERSRRPPQKNLNTNDPRDWLIMTDSGSSYVIVYDKKIYDMGEEFLDNSNAYWTEKFIIAMVAIGGPDNFTTIDRSYGPEKIVIKMIEILLNGEYPNPIYLEENVTNILKNMMGDKLNTEAVKKENRTMYKCWIDKPTVNIQSIIKIEQATRKKHDQYDELKTRIQEIAESLAE